jgi:hypothetical protein
VESSHKAETDGTGVEAWRVGTSAVPASSFIDLCIVTDAEIVTNVSPSVAVHVEVLNISHLLIAGSSCGATSPISVLNYD